MREVIKKEMPSCPRGCTPEHVEPSVIAENGSHYCVNHGIWFTPASLNPPKVNAVRRFESGATRDTEMGKPDYEGFLDPLVIEEYGKFMHKHRKQTDGKMRDSDNWQKGIPLEAYMKSGLRHFLELWKFHRTGKTDDPDGIKFAICAIMFNVMGYLHELLKKERNG